MKTRVLKTALAAAALAGLLVAGAEASNVVGYVKISIPGGLSLVAQPFVQVGGSAPTIGGVFGSALPDGSELFFYVPGTGYTGYVYVEGVGWLDSNFNDANNVTLARGSGFWVKNNSAQPATLVLHGEVPLADNPITFLTGLQLFSYAFPTSLDVQTLTGLTPADGDEIVAFVNGNYITYTYIDGLGWVDANMELASFSLAPGASYWYWRKSGNTNWVQTRNF